MVCLKGNMLDKILYDGIYQCIQSTNIEFHASLFFVYKFTKYLRFFPDGKLSYIERLEGQRIDDNDYNILYNSLGKSYTKFDIHEVEWNRNLIVFKLNEIECKCGPSILSEIIGEKDKFTQIFVNYTQEQKEQTDIFTYISVKNILSTSGEDA